MVGLVPYRNNRLGGEGGRGHVLLKGTEDRGRVAE